MTLGHKAEDLQLAACEPRPVILDRFSARPRKDARVREVDRMIERLPNCRCEVVRMCGLDDVCNRTCRESCVNVPRLVVERQHDGAQSIQLTCLLEQRETLESAVGARELGDQDVRRELANQFDGLRSGSGLANRADPDSIQDLLYRVEPERV